MKADTQDKENKITSHYKTLIKMKTTGLNVRTLLIAALESNKADLAEHEALKEFLTKYDGKPINNRIKWPENYELDTRYGMYNVKVKSSGKTHLIGYNTNPYINTEKLSDFDSCYYSGAKDRIKKIEVFLNDVELLNEMQKTFEEIGSTFKRFCTLCNSLESSKFESYFNPIYYEALKAIGVPASLVSDIRFNKLQLS